MVAWGTCTHSRRRSMSLASRVSNSSRTICVELARLEIWPSQSTPQRLSWLPLVHLNCFTWISLALIIIPHSPMKHLYKALLLLMTILVIHGCISSLTKLKCRKSSNDFPRGLQQTLVWRSSTLEVKMGPSSRILVLMTILMKLVLLTSYLLLILLGRMASWSARTGLSLRWLVLCLMNTRRLLASGLRQFCIPHHQ